MGTPISEKILSSKNIVLDVEVATGDYDAGDVVEYSFGQPVATANTHKRKGIAYESKDLTAAGKLSCVVSGVVQRSGVVGVTNKIVNDLSEFGIFAI